MAAAQRRNLTRQIDSLYAWIATIAGHEELITVDVPAPGGIGSRPLLLVADTRTEAMRYAPHARRWLETAMDTDSISKPMVRIHLQTWTRNGKRPVAVLRAPQAARRD